MNDDISRSRFHSPGPYAAVLRADLSQTDHADDGVDPVDNNPISDFSGETILEEAQRLIYGPRASSYGKARPSFQRVATLWSATTGYDITPEQVVLCMVQLKIAREVNKHDRDNIVDMAGYAGCFQKLWDDE